MMKKNSNINVVLDCWRSLVSISDIFEPDEVINARASLFKVLSRALRHPSIYFTEYPNKKKS